jgi:hypothetical protein
MTADQIAASSGTNHDHNHDHGPNKNLILFLSIACGVLRIRGALWAGKVALGITGFLALIFTWRAIVGWLAVAQGNTDKLTAAVLISVMLAATVVTIVRLLRREVPA